MRGKKLLMAGVIAAISVILDAVLHYSLPQSWALREGLPYFVSKFAFFFVAAAVLLYIFPSPLAIGVVGAAVFGWFYYQYPNVSVGLGNEPLLFRLSWGVVHAGIGTVAAAVVLRRFGSVLVGIGLVVLGLGGLFLNTVYTVVAGGLPHFGGY